LAFPQPLPPEPTPVPAGPAVGFTSNSVALVGVVGLAAAMGMVAAVGVVAAVAIAKDKQ
jgi:hypothetical protein